MKIIEPHSYSGWITVEIDGYHIQAKVYDEPSSFGVRGCRVSKLTIYNKFKRVYYSYDRGLIFDNTPKGLLDKVLKELNSLPKQFSEEKQS